MIKVHPTRPVMNTVEEPHIARRLLAANVPVEWKKSDMRLTATLRDIAVRHGHVAEDGILLDYDVLSAYLKIDDVRESKEFLDNSPISDEGIEKFTTATVKKIQDELDEVLSTPVKAELVEHWDSLARM